MTDKFSLGKKTVGNIDFGRLKSGVKKADIAKNDAIIGSIFDKVDKNANGTLDRGELDALKEQIKQLAGDDNLSEKEIKEFGGQKLNKNERNALFDFLKNLNGTITDDIKKVSTKQDGSQEVEVIEYNDGHTEELYPDGQKIVTVTQGNQKTVTKLNERGQKTEETVTDTENDTETNSFFEDGKISKSTITDRKNNTTTEITYQNEKKVSEEIKDFTNNTETVIKYDSEEQPTGKTVTSGKNEETYEYVNGQYVLTKSIENKGDAGKEIIKEYKQGGGYTQIENTGKEVLITECDDQNNVLKKTKTVEINGEEVTIDLDKDGNIPGVIVQNGESPAVIAKKFGCDLNELLELNKDQLKGSGQHKYFLVGSEIKLPGSVDIENYLKVNSTRQSASAAKSAYAADEQARVAKRLEGKETIEEPLEKDYANMWDLAKDLLVKEGIKNPTKEQITDKMNELISLNGKITPKKGTKIIRTKTQAEIEQEAKKAKEDIRQAVANKQNYREGQQIAKDLYNDMKGLGTKKTFSTNIDKINKDNVASVVIGYRSVSPDESLPEAILDEVSLPLTKRVDSVKFIFNKLVEKAKELNIDTTQFEKEFNNQMTYHLGGSNIKIFDPIIGGLASAISGKSAITAKDKETIAKMTTDEKIQTTVSNLKSVADSAEESLNTQISSDGWAGKLADSMSVLWASNNRKKLVKADLAKYRNVIKDLEACKTETEFKTKFKQHFGVEYDAELVLAYQNRQEQQVLANATYGVEQSFNNSIKGLLTNSTLKEEGHVPPGSSMYVVDNTKEQVYKSEFNAFADILGPGGTTQLNELLSQMGIKPNSSLDEKYNALRQLAIKQSQILHNEVLVATDNKGYDAFTKETEYMYNSAFGTQNDVFHRVQDYNISQQTGAMIIKSGVKAAGAIGLCLIPGVGLVAASVGTAVISATVDTSDRLTSEQGLQDGELGKILLDAGIDGASVFAGGQIAKAFAGLRNVSTFTKMGGEMIGDVVVGAGAEKLQTGQITLQGVIFQCIFSGAGHLVGLKKVGHADSNPTPAPSNKALNPDTPVLNKATIKPDIPGAEPRVIERPGSVKLRNDKKVDVKKEVNNRANDPNVTPKAMAQTRNQLDAMGSGNRAIRREGQAELDAAAHSRGSDYAADFEAGIHANRGKQIYRHFDPKSTAYNSIMKESEIRVAKEYIKNVDSLDELNQLKTLFKEKNTRAGLAARTNYDGFDDVMKAIDKRVKELQTPHVETPAPAATPKANTPEPVVQPKQNTPEPAVQPKAENHATPTPKPKANTPELMPDGMRKPAREGKHGADQYSGEVDRVISEHRAGEPLKSYQKNEILREINSRAVVSDLNAIEAKLKKAGLTADDKKIIDKAIKERRNKIEHQNRLIKQEQELQAMKKREEQAKLEAEKKAQLEAEEKAKLEAERKAQLEAKNKHNPDNEAPAISQQQRMEMKQIQNNINRAKTSADLDAAQKWLDKMPDGEHKNFIQEQLNTKKADLAARAAKQKPAPATNSPRHSSQTSEMNLNELVRFKGNQGKVVDAEYVQASKDLRDYFNRGFNSGQMSPREYTNYIRKAHKIAANGKNGNLNWYKNAGQGSIDVDPGQIRDYDLRNARDEGNLVDRIARNPRYNDPYSVDGSGQVNLKGISDKAKPVNVGLQHFYPDGKYMDQYFTQMSNSYNKVIKSIENHASQTEILENIAEHYQYAANARPFGQINNSLFMNEINTLLLKAGMKPMPHGMLDHVAQRFQPETFKQYFIDEYNTNHL